MSPSGGAVGPSSCHAVLMQNEEALRNEDSRTEASTPTSAHAPRSPAGRASVQPACSPACYCPCASRYVSAGVGNGSRVSRRATRSPSQSSGWRRMPPRRPETGVRSSRAEASLEAVVDVADQVAGLEPLADLEARDEPARVLADQREDLARAEEVHVVLGLREPQARARGRAASSRSTSARNSRSQCSCCSEPAWPDLDHEAPAAALASRRSASVALTVGLIGPLDHGRAGRASARRGAPRRRGRRAAPAAAPRSRRSSCGCRPATRRRLGRLEHGVGDALRGLAGVVAREHAVQVGAVERPEPAPRVQAEHVHRRQNRDDAPEELRPRRARPRRSAAGSSRAARARRRRSARSRAGPPTSASVSGASFGPSSWYGMSKSSRVGAVMWSRTRAVSSTRVGPHDAREERALVDERVLAQREEHAVDRRAHLGERRRRGAGSRCARGARPRRPPSSAPSSATKRPDVSAFR